MFPPQIVYFTLPVSSSPVNGEFDDLEAKRLLKFLDYFVGIGSENVPANSLLREFIGGGCFHV